MAIEVENITVNDLWWDDDYDDEEEETIGGIDAGWYMFNDDRSDMDR